MMKLLLNAHNVRETTQKAFYGVCGMIHNTQITYTGKWKPQGTNMLPIVKASPGKRESSACFDANSK